MNKKLASYFNKYTLFMAFPILMVLWQNLTLVYFALMFFTVKKKSLFFQPTHWILGVVMLFGLGAIISVIDSNALDGVSRGLTVLPNYLYWTVTVIFIVNISRYLNHITLSKYIYHGMLLSIAYYYASPIIPKIPGFVNSFSPNGFAFLCICFTAPAATYLQHKKGLLYALLLLLVVLVTLLFAGRRAGFVLVLISSMLSITFKSIKFKYLASGTITSAILFLLLQLAFVEEVILSANPRVHELIYANDDIATEDRSVLTRRLMLEKTFLIFAEHPLTGIGLNNFSNYNVNLTGDFEGGQYVANKEGINATSAHNSYASLLGEGGLFLFVPFIILLLFNFYKFVVNFAGRSQLQNSFYWAFLFACIHLIFISAVLNVYAWFLIGLVTAMSSTEIESFNQKNFNSKNRTINY